MDLFSRIGVFSLEPLASFAKNTMQISTEQFEHVWVGHRDRRKMEGLVAAGELATLSSTLAAARAAAGTSKPESHPVRPHFNQKRIIENIVSVFKYKAIITYLMNDCYILHEANGSWEPILDCDINAKMTRAQRDSRKRKLTNVQASRAKKARASSPDLFSSDELKAYKTVRKGVLKWPKRKEATRSEQRKGVGNRTENILWRTETLSLDRILYSLQQNDQVFQDDLPAVVKEIILTPVGNRPVNLSNWEAALAQCTRFSIILQQFVANRAKTSRNNGFRRIFQRHLKSAGGQGRFIKKQFVSSFICDVIRRVIPGDFFSSNRQRKNFLHEICRLISVDRYQIVAIQRFITVFQQEHPLWLQEVPQAIRELLLIKILKFFINDFILATLKSIFYITECGSTGFELFYFLNSEMESKIDRQINSLKHQGKIEDTHEDDVCLEKKWMNGKVTSDELVDGHVGPDDLLPADRMYQLPSCRMRFMPKTPDTDECRLITIRPAKAQVTCPVFEERARHRAELFNTVKHYCDCGISSRGTGTIPLPSSPRLHTAWHKAVLLKQSGNVFYVKGDIVDAYGSVVHKQLLDNLVLLQPDAKQNWKLITIKEWYTVRGKLTLSTRTSFSRKVKSKRILHSRTFVPGPGYPTAQMKDVIRQIISHQVLIHGSRRFRMIKGLCQGGAGSMSNRLCDIYYTMLDHMYMGEFTNCEDCVLVRAVDDYLFISTDPAKAQLVLRIFSEGHPEFNVKFAKIKTNVADNNLSITNFLGLQFNFDDLTVRPSYKFKCPEDILHQMKLTYQNMDPTASKEYFLHSRLTNINNMKLLPIILDERWCGFEQAVVVVNEACRIQAWKAVATAMLLRPITDQLLIEALKKCAKRITRLIKQVDFRQVLYIFWQNIYRSFLRHNSCFSDFIKTVQSKIVLLYSKMKFSSHYITLRPDWWNPENVKAWTVDGSNPSATSAS